MVYTLAREPISGWSTADMSADEPGGLPFGPMPATYRLGVISATV
jgi:hypothetical protein